MQLGNYKYIELIMQKTELSEEEIINAVDAELEKHVEYRETTSRPLKNRDKAIIDFTGTKDGVPVEGGSSKNYSLLIGSKTFIDGFEEQLIGMNVGETRVINVVFPKNYHSAQLAGQSAQFEVKLNGLQEAVKPVLNDEFAASLGIEGVENADGFFEYMQNKLWDEKNEENYKKFKEEVYGQILSNSPVELSQEEVLNATNEQLAQIKKMAENYGVPMETLLTFMGFADEKNYVDSVIPTVENQLKLNKLFDAIAKEENLSADADEIENFYTSIAESQKVPLATAKQQYSLEEVKRDLIRTKVSELIMQFPVDYSYANFGVDEAQYFLGLKYIEKGEKQKAQEWLTKAAEQGNAKAKSALNRL